MTGVIRGNLLKGDTTVKPDGPVSLTLKRDDGLPDTEVVTDADGNWQVEVESATKKKVKFSFFDKSKPLGEHEVEFVKELEIIPASGRFTKENLNGFHGRLIDQDLNPISDAEITYKRKYDDAENWIESSVTTNEHGYFNVMWGINELEPKKLYIQISYGDLSDEFTYDFSDGSLTTYFVDPVGQEELAPGETLKVVGRAFPNYGSGDVNLTEDAFLGHFVDNPLYFVDNSESLESGGKFSIDVDGTHATLMSNNGNLEVKPPVVQGLKPPAIMRFGVRSVLINNPDLHYSGSFPLTCSVYTADYKKPNVDSSELEFYDFNNSPHSYGSYLTEGNDRWYAGEDFVSIREGGYKHTVLCRGRPLADNYVRCFTDGDMLNLVGGTRNWVHVGNEVVNRLALTDNQGNPRSGVTVSFFKGDSETAFRQATTDDLGLVEITLPTESEVTRTFMRAEADGVEATWYNDWVPVTLEVVESVSTPFLPVYFDRDFFMFLTTPLGKDGQPFNPQDSGVYEGLTIQLLDRWYVRPYLSKRDGACEYLLPLQDDTNPIKGGRLSMTCDHFHTEKDVVVGKRVGLNPLPYAQGTSVANQDLTTGWLLLDDALEPVEGGVIDVWIDDRSGAVDHKLTTDKYGIVEITVPFKEGELVRKAYAKHGTDQFELELMWTEKNAACQITITPPQGDIGVDELVTFDVRSLDQHGNEVNEESPVLFNMYGFSNLGVYDKVTHKVEYLGSDRTTDVNVQTNDKVGEQELVFFTEAGFKTVKFNAIQRPVRNTDRLEYSSSTAFPDSEALVGFRVSDDNGQGVPGETVEIRYLGEEVDKLVGNTWIKVHEGGSDEVITTLTTDEFGIVEFPTTMPTDTGTHSWSGTTVSAGPKDRKGKTDVYVHWRDGIITDLKNVKSIPVTESGEKTVFSAELWENVSADNQVITEDNMHIHVYIKELDRTLENTGTFYKGHKVCSIDEVLPDGTYHAVLYVQNAQHEVTLSWGSVAGVNPTSLVYNNFVPKKFPIGARYISSVSLNDDDGKITAMTRAVNVEVYNSDNQVMGEGVIDVDGNGRIQWSTNYGTPNPIETYEFRDGSKVLFSMTAGLVTWPKIKMTPYNLTNPVIGQTITVGAFVENEEETEAVDGIYVTMEDNYGNLLAEGETDEFGFFDISYDRIGEESHMFVRAKCGQSSNYETAPWTDTNSPRWVDLQLTNPPTSVDNDGSVFMNGMMRDQDGNPADRVAYSVYDVRNRSSIGGRSKSDGRIEPSLDNIALGKNPVVVTSANGMVRHVVNYKKMPASADIVSGHSEAMAFDGNPEVTYQLKDSEGNNYVPNEGEVVNLLTQSGRYQKHGTPVGPTGLVTMPWFSKGIGHEVYILANEDMSKALNTTPTEHIAIKEVKVFHASDYPQSGDPGIMLANVQDFNDNPIPNIEFRVKSTTDGFELDAVYKTDANGVGKVLLAGQSDGTNISVELTCGNAVTSYSIGWEDGGESSPGTVILDALPSEASEDDNLPITGKVVDSEGNGISDAFVYLYIGTPNSTYYQEDSVNADADGRFSITPWLESGNLKFLVVNGNDFDSAEVLCYSTPMVTMTNLTIRDIHENQRGRVSALYKDRYGNPVQGETVEFRFDSASGELIDTKTTNEKGHAWTEVTWTQAQGHSEIYAVCNEASDSTYINVAEAGDVAPVVSTIAWHNNVGFVHPEMPALIMGKVLDQHGNPYSKAEVNYYRPDIGSRNMTYTDSDGNFTLEVSPGRFDPTRKDLFGVRGKFTEIAPKWNMGTKFKSGAIKFNKPDFPEGIPYDSTITLSGTVKDTDGSMAEVGDAVIKLKARVRSEGSELGLKEFTVSPDGTWSVDIPTPDKEIKFDVWLEDEYGNGCDRVALWAGPPKTKTLAFAPPTHDYIPEGQNHTRVVYYLLDEEGKPMPNVSIDFKYKGDADSRWNYGSMDRTDEDGHVNTRIQLRNSTTIELRIKAEGLTTKHTIVRTSDPVGTNLVGVYYPDSTSVSRGLTGWAKLTDISGKAIPDLSDVKVGIYDLVTRETYDLKPWMLDNINIAYNFNPPAGRHRFMQYSDAYMDYYQVPKVVEVTESDPSEVVVPTQVVLSPTIENGGLVTRSNMNIKTGFRLVDDQYRDWNATGEVNVYDDYVGLLRETKSEGEVHQVQIYDPLDPGLRTWRVFADYKEVGTIPIFIVEGDDVMNLVPGSTVVNRVDQTAVAMFGCYSATNMTPTVGKTVNVWEVGKEGAKLSLTTDDRGLVAFDLPAQTTPGVYHYIVEYDGNQVPFDFHWVAADMVLGESFGETFFPTVWAEEEYQGFKAEVVDQNGDVVSNGVKGISVKDLDDPEMNYWYNIDGEYVRPAYFTKGKHLIGMSAGAVAETFNIFSGNATGLRTLAYAQGKGLDGQNLKVAFGLTNESFVPINGAVVKVWIGEKSGDSHYEVTTGTYGIAEFDIPQPEGVTRTWLYAESNGHELKIPVVWAKKPTPSKFSTLTVPTSIPAGSTLDFSATIVNQDDTPDSIDSWKAIHGGVYVKANQKFEYLFSASGDHSLNIIGDLSPGTHEIVFFTLAGYEVKQITIT
ncbi:hypothetical protein [Photobacterium phage PDCC-1]|uniref:Big-1 domain-containing protein n=1 Tax=Photobacterium phage PDCC-1 TaxID=2664246 RepID=A0A6B9J8E0_9CAUD|nr:hypothetical protein HWC77_gp188 [Photobacterium phage PDCC-1]QGZ14551.1 hypothetical protein [Photobacterium phage PDCC-1]